MARTIKERIERMGEEWAYKQLVKAYEQMGKDLSSENLRTLNQVYQRVNHLFFNQLTFDAESKKEQFLSGEIQFSNISEIEAFTQKLLEKALTIANRYMPIYTTIYHVIDKRSREKIE